ncbi:MAG: serine hydrolase domain-containing protein [Nakamurella sp.]
MSIQESIHAGQLSSELDHTAFAAPDAVIGSAATIASGEIAATGPEVTALAGIDVITKQLMRAKSVPGGAVAIVKDRRLVFARGYTNGGNEFPIVRPTSLFRIASCSKPITRFAITALLGDDLDRAIAPILNLVPPPGKRIRPEFAKVTIRHLLDHSSGLTSSFGDFEAADAFGVTVPIDKYRIAGNVVTEPFLFAPGSRNEYSNYGYLFLGLVVEKLTGQSYEKHVRESIFAPIGTTRPFIGRSLLSERAPGEVSYHDAAGRRGPSRVHADRRQVDICYGYMNMTNQDAFGGWVLAAPDYARLLSVHGASMNFSHGGFFAGTTAWVAQLGNGVGVVALFNKDMNGNSWDPAHPELEYLDAIAQAAGAVTNWPAHDLFPSMLPRTPRKWTDADLSTLLGAPQGLEPKGWVRTDGVTSVVTGTGGNRIHELTLSAGRWHHFSLTEAAGASLGAHPEGGIRTDGVSSVLYRDADFHLIELALSASTGRWTRADLTSITGAVLPNKSAGELRPRTYRRSDGVTSVVYRGVDDHIHEIALHGPSWRHFDLTAASGARNDAAGMPFGLVRADGVSTVLYPGADGHAHELTLVAGRWQHGDLSVLTSAGPKVAGPLTGYVRADGVTSALYRGTDDHLHEIALHGNRWHHFDLTVAAAAPPVATDDKLAPSGYLRADRVSAVVYRGADQHVHELALQGTRWRHADLTATAKGPNCATNPFGYVRADGVNAVVYRAADGTVHELALP